MPTGGFGGFEFEFGCGFEGVAGGRDFGIDGIEFLLEVEGAIRFFVEARGDGRDGVGEEGVVGGVLGEDGEAGFEGVEEWQHKRLKAEG